VKRSTSLRSSAGAGAVEGCCARRSAREGRGDAAVKYSGVAGVSVISSGADDDDDDDDGDARGPEKVPSDQRMHVPW